MQIHIYTIERKEEFPEAVAKFVEQARRFASIHLHSVYSKKLAKASNPSHLYTELLLPFTRHGHNVVLTPEGELMDTPTFTRRFLNFGRVNFFIGGAYGFEEEFKKVGENLSLSPLTFSHQIAKLVLLEQVYRGLTLKYGHPYHK
jgi:23S rRNA (pseudouridine1915-N3)-methyltransferase